MKPLAEFFEDGLKYAKAAKEAGGRDPWKEINPKTTPSLWAAWSAYFLATYGRLPAVWRAVEAGQVDSFTVPAELPELFDLGYVPGTHSLPRRAPVWRDGGHVHRAKEWLAKAEGKELAEIQRLDGREFVIRGFAALKKQIGSTRLGMRRPKPLPKERIG